jgi:hypothetical protein
LSMARKSQAIFSSTLLSARSLRGSEGEVQLKWMTQPGRGLVPSSRAAKVAYDDG